MERGVSIIARSKGVPCSRSHCTCRRRRGADAGGSDIAHPLFMYIAKYFIIIFDFKSKTCISHLLVFLGLMIATAHSPMDGPAVMCYCIIIIAVASVSIVTGVTCSVHYRHTSIISNMFHTKIQKNSASAFYHRFFHDYHNASSNMTEDISDTSNLHQSIMTSPQPQRICPPR